MSPPWWKHSLSGCNYRKHELGRVGFFFFHYTSKTDSSCVLCGQTGDVRDGRVECEDAIWGSEMVGAGSVVGHRLDAMVLCNPPLLPQQHPETYVWCVNDAACENGSGRLCDWEPELGVWQLMVRRAQGHGSFHLPNSGSLSRHLPTSIY